MPARFDRIGAHFLKNIYATPKGRIRLAVLQRDLAPLLADKPLRLLDIGGGAGQMALWYAALGHHVTLIDHSAALLQQAREQARELELEARLQFRCRDIFAADALADAEDYDGICCHAVLEWVADAPQLLQIAARALRPGGFFSLMYYNRRALVFAQHVFGNFAYLDRELRPKRKAAKLTPEYPRDPEAVAALLDALELHRERISAVRCFYDYMKPHDRARHTEDTLIARELALSADTHYLPVARYIHELRRKPG